MEKRLYQNSCPNLINSWPPNSHGALALSESGATKKINTDFVLDWLTSQHLVVVLASDDGGYRSEGQQETALPES